MQSHQPVAAFQTGPVALAHALPFISQQLSQAQTSHGAVLPASVTVALPPLVLRL